MRKAATWAGNGSRLCFVHGDKLLNSRVEPQGLMLLVVGQQWFRAPTLRSEMKQFAAFPGGGATQVPIYLEFWNQVPILSPYGRPWPETLSCVGNLCIFKGL